MVSHPNDIRLRVNRTKSGEICMHSSGIFSLICEFCDSEYFTLEAFMVHAYEHTPKPTATICSKIKIEAPLIIVDDEDDNNHPKSGIENVLTNTAVAVEHLESPTTTVTTNVRKGGGFDCRFCGKFFKCISYFSDHENVHTGKRPHQCSHCSRGFANKRSLQKHILALHTKDRPNKCSICGKGFISKHLLTSHVSDKHMRETDPQRCFSCPDCGENFKTRGQLRYHKSLWHHINPVSCDICKGEFLNREFIYRHMQKHVIHLRKMHANAAA